MSRHSTIFVTLLALLAATMACRRGGGDVPDAAPSVYYWRTTLRLDSTERDFLLRHHVTKMYTRFFDVVLRDSTPNPNATLQFLDTVPAGVEVIPVVFILENCLRHDLNDYARLLVDRVVQMCETNDLPAPRELQIDCDWTRHSQDDYFRFLGLVRSAAADHHLRLSATIRLHQLSMPPPPVDYGVLMVYNTGDATRTNGHNPILDYRDVQPYLRHVGSYSLPLCAAYPTYDWQLLFGHDGFKALLHHENLADSTLYHPLPGGREWLVVASRDLPELSDDASTATWVTVGDTVRRWHVAPAEILRVSRALQEQRPGINAQVITYALDTRNINHYTITDYEAIYHP
ncbi:MAG: hypothetical protein IJT30_08625 [Muribaculaceae bacterium]|nr:hypothetical protein [Muribaculaceae bacterium]